MSRFVQFCLVLVLTVIVSKGAFAADDEAPSVEGVSRVASDADFRSKENEGAIAQNTETLRDLNDRLSKLERSHRELAKLVAKNCATPPDPREDKAGNPLPAVPGSAIVNNRETSGVQGACDCEELRARLSQIEADLANMNVRGDHATALVGYDSLSSKLDSLSDELDALSRELNQPGREDVPVAFTLYGVYADVVAAPPIPGMGSFGGVSWLGGSAGIAIGYGQETVDRGMVVVGSGGLDTFHGYSFDVGVIRYKITKNGRLAYGFGGGAGGELYGAFLMPGFDAYSVGVRPELYLRVRLHQNKDAGKSTYLVIAPFGQIGQVAIPGTAAFEARGGIRIRIERHRNL
ncbi:MAG: hypothetical protein Q8P30_03745 [Candidatus Uhrbacteria bacterium]|nr:hypothetical protein [Candidatus Uhrbacteria bacterium]